MPFQSTRTRLRFSTHTVASNLLGSWISETFIKNMVASSRGLGEPLDPQWLTDAWRKLTARAGVVGVRLHDLRHFRGSLLLREGTDIKAIQERLGHSSISITLDIYSHVMPGIQERAAITFAEAMRNSAPGKPA